MTIFESMLASYAQGDGTATPNAEQEVCQKIALAGLHRGVLLTISILDSH